MQGLLRGATDQRVYDGRRLEEISPTRLFQDHVTTKAWRQSGFYPVLNEEKNQTEAAGVLAQMLNLKKAHPLPEGKLLPESFDLSLNRENHCPKPADFERYAEQQPLGGMPFALPALSDQENNTLMDWIRLGAPYDHAPALSELEQNQRDQWEKLLNQPDNKTRLIARYLFEHLYLAALYFEDAGQKTRYFSLVRSTSPPGEAIKPISTRRPFDDPGHALIYYRFREIPSTVVAKTHMPYRLDSARLNNWRAWFFDADFTVEQLPGYAPEQAANPFLTFEAIPTVSRHQFLLDEGQFTIMNFIKGAVCRGATALSVIQDHFWVFFVSSDAFNSTSFTHFLAQQDQHLTMPAASSSEIWSIKDWHHYASAQQAYLRAKGEFIAANRDALAENKLGVFWNGKSEFAVSRSQEKIQANANAGLTVFRHYDSASVVQGLVGRSPKTAWLIDYPILERIHYLLVAGFDVYGSVSHQTMTRLYMDFLRMEAEMNFVAFLPEEARRETVASWYVDAHDDVQAYLDAYFKYDRLPPLYEYQTSEPKAELFDALRARLPESVREHAYKLDQNLLSDSLRQAISKLNTLTGEAVNYFPEVTYIYVPELGVMSLLRDRDYRNISSMFNEEDRHRPERDQFSLVYGLLGAYPNSILHVAREDLPRLIEGMMNIDSEASYGQFLDRYAVRRTDSQFWSVSDAIHHWYAEQEPITSGVIDVSRLENR